jgi:hypothetical protein
VQGDCENLESGVFWKNSGRYPKGCLEEDVYDSKGEGTQRFDNSAGEQIGKAEGRQKKLLQYTNKRSIPHLLSMGRFKCVRCRNCGLPLEGKQDETNKKYSSG